MNPLNKENMSTEDKIFEFVQQSKSQIISSLVAFLGFSVLGLIFSRKIIEIIQSSSPFDLQFIQIAPADIFIDSFKIAFLFGLYMSMPIIQYQWLKTELMFLGNNNKNKLILALIGEFILFTLGILTALYIVAPILLYLFIGLGADLVNITISLSSYISFCLGLIFLTGLIFEMPLFIIIISNTNIISSKKLLSYRRPVAILAFIISFILISPPELMSLIILTGFILIFYIVFIVLLKLFKK